ncbi:MAG TPA: sulfide/dihydroorotate dehydrogenase-like FAD/NAD-binding protein [Candidatus Nanoarchaeia archaeon]|nr:sulfide/dihydroorotate dehydrogenase-like FAD/NAD-binding protein [Candidatus Nanoarchaeia archaeon]
MYPILQKRKLSEGTYLMEVDAPDVAKKAKPGQFLMVRIDEKGERIPLTIADSSKRTITLVFLVVGKTTEQLSGLKKGDELIDVAGPLGNPSKIQSFGNVAIIGGGLGIAPIYLIAKALKEAKNRVTTIIGAKSKDHLFWEERFKEISDRVFIATDDGSKGQKGFVSDILKELMQREKLDLVIAIGPPIMMKVISDMTRSRIKTIVSLNPIMIDGMGMCGGCRVSIDGEIKFACCDGPEFNGHKVDWQDLMNRNRTYVEEEKCACGGK